MSTKPATTARFNTIMQAIATRLGATHISPTTLHEGRGPNHGDLLMADITTQNRTIRLHAWANARHTLTKLFADPGDPRHAIQLPTIGQPAQRVASRAADLLQ